MLMCVHCQKECKNLISHSAHERTCPKNIDRIYKNNKTGKSGANQYTYGAVCSDETRAKLSESSRRQVWSDERKLEHSHRMKVAVENHPESYTSSNRGRVKQFVSDGICFQGKWEFLFYRYCKDKNISIERPNVWFPYEWCGTRKYFPDFYLPDKKLYVEVKGYETERDKAKWEAFPHDLKIVRKSDINAIQNNTWDFS